MITATFFTCFDALIGFRIGGHAYFSESGTDIICAAVSSAAYMAANTITDVEGIDAKIKEKDGFMEVIVPKTDAEKAKTVLSGLKLHLTQLSKQYPKNIEITYTEV
ncbi:MAG TPA: ribosomal-processing cysteine protease Prp [Oscillospiraceae bacterium]|nr:ribosomal-processing cysteine protease Prp [Oscillospiraceae bacterium]